MQRKQIGFGVIVAGLCMAAGWAEALTVDGVSWSKRESEEVTLVDVTFTISGTAPRQEDG